MPSAASSDDERTCHSLSLHQRLNRVQLLDLSTLLRGAWCQVLWLSRQQTNAKETKGPTDGDNMPSTSCLDLDSSLFALGSDIIGLAQVACYQTLVVVPCRALKTLSTTPLCVGTWP